MLSEKMHTANLADAPAYWFLNAVHILMASNVSADGAYSLIHVTAPPEFTTPYHLHHTEDEAFYVLDGEFTFICDGKKTVLGANSYIFLPRGLPHGFRSSSKKESHILTFVIPGGEVGFVGMMLEMAVPILGGVIPKPVAPDLQRLAALCEKNKIDILGTLPE